MAWAGTERTPIAPGGRVADGTVTVLIATAQLCIALAAVVVVGMGRADAYDRPAGSAFGVLLLLVVGPPAAFALGLLHTVALSMPVALGAHAAAGWVRGPEWLRQGALLVALGALYAIPASLMGIPYASAWAAIAASGVLPLLGVAYFLRREAKGRPVGLGGVWARILLTGLVLLVVTVSGCVTALSKGWVGGEYEVPDLSAREMAGVWTSEDGPAGIRLRADGSAVLTAVPYEAWEGPERRCDGEGTWTYTPASGDVRGSVGFEVHGREADACDLGAWKLGGTTEHPELYALFGDPDVGDVRVLVKRS